MRLTNEKRREIAQAIRVIRLLEQEAYDKRAYFDYEEALEVEQDLLISYRFLLGELEVLINEPDKLL